MDRIEPPSSPAPWLRLRDVDFFHGDNRVLSGIDLDLNPGGHYILAGPNGAGKSTLLDIVARLKTPAAGRVALMGRDIASSPPLELARLLALAPQEFPVNFSFSVREVVSMGRRPHLGRWGRLGQDDIRAVDDAIRTLSLEKLANRPVTALSGGERRRCLIARTIAQATPVVLLDEPCAGLDIAHALSVMALARDLARAGSLVLTVSHDLNLAAAFGDEFIFLKNGSLAGCGRVGEIFTDAVLSDIYETPARVRRDDFTGGLSVSFRGKEGNAPC